MFSQEELSIIKRSCFTINAIGGSFVELQSQNGDRWLLIETQESLSVRERAKGAVGKKFYRLMHRHGDEECYHDHAEYLTVLDSILEVLDHDDHKLGRKRGREHTPFDELLEEMNPSTK